MYYAILKDGTWRPVDGPNVVDPDATCITVVVDKDGWPEQEVRPVETIEWNGHAARVR